MKKQLFQFLSALHRYTSAWVLSLSLLSLSQLLREVTQHAEYVDKTAPLDPEAVRLVAASEQTGSANNAQ